MDRSWILLLCLLMFLICIDKSFCRTCYRRVARRETTRMCCASDWGHCTNWDYLTVTKYYTESYCCTGWKGSGCNTPICNPKCINNGTCVAPNKCNCPSGYIGGTCQTVTCSHLKPCFPGLCSSGTICNCVSGFSGITCLRMGISQKPEITHASTTMTFIQRTGRHAGVMYWYMSDASDPNKSTPDNRWTRFHEFNKLEFLVEALYNPPYFPDLPSYVSDFSFGIISGKVRATLTKVAFTGGIENSFNRTYVLDIDKVETNIARLNRTDEHFFTSIEHGDNLTIVATVQSGGYEVVKNPDNNQLKTYNFQPQQSSKTMIFHFDFEAPYHCLNTCNDLPIDIGKDITEKSLNITWSGWKDDLDVVDRYTLEVHELRAGLDGLLTEVSPFRPLFVAPINASSEQPYSVFYTPPKSGMYSIVLDVADTANNSVWARQFVLYDTTSTVTVDSTAKFYVVQARPETNYHWISKINGPLNVTWKGYFRNQLHDENKLLNGIKPFLARAMDGMYVKEVKEDLDDHNGTRTKAPIDNIHGIISFEISFDKDHAGGNTTFIQSWKRVSDFTTESTTIESRLSNGDTLSIWVRAKDIMGNELVDRILVHADSSAPTITSVQLQKGVRTKFQYGSRILISTEDEQSGIHQIKWAIEDINSSKQYQTGDISGNFSSTDPGTLGYCIPMGDCYYSQHVIEIDNCWVAVAKLSSSQLRMSISVYNMAMVFKTQYQNLTELLQFDGIESCYNSEKQDNSAIIGAAVGGGIGGLLIILLIVVIIILFLMKTGRLSKKQKGARYQTNLPSKHQLDNKKAYNNSAYCAESEMDDIYLYGGMKFDTTPAWIIPHSKITLEDKIGSGRFADIFKARYDTKQNDKTSVVAKMLQMNFKEEDKLVMMAKINFFATHVGEHRNVLGFIGAATDNDHFGPYMILEYCEEGNLRDWLLRKKDKVSDDTIEKLFQMVFGVAQGMKYLASKKIIHRRLAARNILLPFTLMPKVAGFGPSPSDETKDKNDTTKERVPVKWMAPECTESTADATTKSDVWSYGIVMWEILSLGETPYGGISSRDVPSKIQNGHRLGRPEYAEDIHYNLMKKCWNLKQDGRPDFNVIVKELDNTFRTSPSDNYYYQS